MALYPKYPDSVRFRGNFGDVLAGIQRRKEGVMLRPDLPGVVQCGTRLSYHRDFMDTYNPKAIIADETKNLVNQALNQWSNQGSQNNIDGYPMVEISYHETMDPWELQIAVEIRTAPL